MKTKQVVIVGGGFGAVNAAQIGREAAVVEIGSLRLTGVLAWHLWWIVHFLSLVGFQNRLVVFLRWFWSDFNHDRPALLITNRQPEAITEPIWGQEDVTQLS